MGAAPSIQQLLSRDNAMSGMMGMVRRGVECPAKKAMTMLSDGSATTCLLPNCSRSRRIILRRRKVHNY
jgi:hypothetical protein